MKIQINLGKNLGVHDGLEEYFSGELEKSLTRFADRIISIMVHIEDENSLRSGPKDKRCLIEVRPANLQPIAVTEHSDTVPKAFVNAMDKIKRMLANTYDKQNEH
jgi:ribosomal subunit interface protein